MGLKDRQGSRGGDCGGLCGRSGWRVHGQGGDWGGLRRLGRLREDRAGVGGWVVGGWRLAGTGIGLKDKHGGEAGEQVNGFLAGGFDDRGVEERRAEAEEVCHHGDRGGRLPLALHLIEIDLHFLEIAPKKPLLFEHIHRKGVLLLG